VHRAGLADPRIEREVEVRESLCFHRDLGCLGAQADRLIRGDHVRARRGLDQEMSGAVACKACNYLAVLLEREPRLKRRVARFPYATDGLDRT